LIFIAAGGARWSWDFVLILAGVVGFPELGHYCVMRLFKYRDLRMFFVPLLGAAVTGRNYNVKGWQRAVVSLAGPVPGIVVGLALMWVGSATHNPSIQKIALVALLVNGINLLPFVPLDGGWVLHAILFSRQYVLESAFLLFAGLALVSATALGHGKLWMYLGILVLVGLPTSHRLARIAGKLRKSDIPTQSPDDQNIPTETALAIFGELKKEQGATRLIKHLASQTLDVFQKINATPPGVLASTMLLMVYLVALGASFWGTANLLHLRRAFNESAGFPNIFPKPTRTMDPNEIRLAGATNVANVEWAAPVVIGTFESREKATAAFDPRQLQFALKLTW